MRVESFRRLLDRAVVAGVLSKSVAYGSHQSCERWRQTTTAGRRLEMRTAACPSLPRTSEGGHAMHLLWEPRLNLGIVAHVDAGKTTLTERLLFEAGVTTRSAASTTATRRPTPTRSNANAASPSARPSSTFTVGDVKVNLIDTPGHSDFVAEVERALAVLDGAVLVVSAVEGVQAQTRVLIRSSSGSGSRSWSSSTRSTGSARRTTRRWPRSARRSPATPSRSPSRSTWAAGSASVTVRRSGLRRRAGRAAVGVRRRCCAQYVDGGAGRPSASCWRPGAARRAAGRLHPVFFGAALTGVGVARRPRWRQPLPAPADGTADEPLHASVFKIERGAPATRSPTLRLHAGTLTRATTWSRHHARPRRSRRPSRGTRAPRQHVHRRCRHRRRRRPYAGDIAKIIGSA